MTNQPVEFAFAITGSKCDSFNFSKFAIDNKENIAFDKYRFSFTIRIDVEKEKELVIVKLGTTLAKLENDQEIIATLDSTTVFKVLNLSKFLIENAEGTLIPDPIVIQFFSIAISNARGMFTIKLADSIYSNAVVPIIDVSKMIQKKPSNIA